MELEKTGKHGRQLLELYAHTPNPCDAFTDSRYAMTVTFRMTLSKQQWKNTTLSNLYDFLPKLHHCRMDKVKLEVETLLDSKHKWLVSVVFFHCCLERVIRKVTVIAYRESVKASHGLGV